MNDSFSPLRRGILTCFAAAIAVILFLRPQVCREACLEAATLCVQQLMPALFPFLIVSNLIVDTGTADLIGLPLRPLAHLMGQPNCGAGVLFIGAIGGFAPAAGCVAGLYRQGRLSEKQAANILPACICSAPSFIILAVGAMLGNTMLGVFLFVAQLAACWLCGLIFSLIRSLFLYVKCFYITEKDSITRPLCRLQGCKSKIDIARKPIDTSTQIPSLSAGISNAAVSFLKLCGFVIFFRMLSAGIYALIPFQAMHDICMLLEVSSGCISASATGRYAAYLCCTVLSLQSISVLMQIRSILPQEISIRPLLFARLFHLPLSLALLYGQMRLFPSIPVFSSLTTRLVIMPRCAPGAAICLFAASCWLAVFLARSLHTKTQKL